ncbi:MAG: Nramp family divalent metal transporter [Opitutus sp.]
MSPAPAVTPPIASEVQPAPTSFAGLLRQLGPGLIITSIIVGSGELIVTPKLGAEIGFRLLWFIIFGCLVKVFVQIELGRYVITRGRSTLEALNTLPGPRLAVSWVLWIWLAMYLCVMPQVAGIVGGTATAFKLGGADLPVGLLACLISASCAILLVFGRYALIEWVSTALVAGFTITTVVAVVALQSTPYAITSAQLASGFSFHLPTDLATAFGAFGLIGVGATELIFYPYWCLEKGYARKLGPDDGTAAWRVRAAAWLRVMRIDAWMSFVLYTATTVAFYLLGAAILHAKALRVESLNMIETLSFMYRDTFGHWSMWLFLVGAVAVLYSTLFGATASNARLFADALNLWGLKRYRDAEHRRQWIRIGSVLLPVIFTAIFLAVGNPVSLVFVGAIAQGLMLPFLAGAALYFHFTAPHRELRARPLSLAGLMLSATAMSALGVYQVVSAFR